MNDTTEACQVQVSDGGSFPHFHKCGRPIKRNGVCGLHAAAEDRRAKAEEERRERQHRSEAARMEAERACTKLWTLGIDATAHYGNNGFTGGIVLDAAATEQILELLEL